MDLPGVLVVDRQSGSGSGGGDGAEFPEVGQLHGPKRDWGGREWFLESPAVRPGELWARVVWVVRKQESRVLIAPFVAHLGVRSERGWFGGSLHDVLWEGAQKGFHRCAGEVAVERSNLVEGAKVVVENQVAYPPNALLGEPFPPSGTERFSAGSSYSWVAEERDGPGKEVATRGGEVVVGLQLPEGAQGHVPET